MQAMFQCLGLQRGVNLVSKVLYLPVPWRGPGNKVGWGGGGVMEEKVEKIFAVIGRMEPEICTKMLTKLSKKLRAKFPATTPGCSMLKIAVLMMLS